MGGVQNGELKGKRNHLEGKAPQIFEQKPTETGKEEEPRTEGLGEEAEPTVNRGICHSEGREKGGGRRGEETGKARTFSKNHHQPKKQRDTQSRSGGEEILIKKFTRSEACYPGRRNKRGRAGTGGKGGQKSVAVCLMKSLRNSRGVSCGLLMTMKRGKLKSMEDCIESSDQRWERGGQIRKARDSKKR